MTPLPDRILGALELAPMTVHQLGRCLSVSDQTIRNRMPADRVVRVGSVKTWGKSWPLYGLSEKGPSR